MRQLLELVEAGMVPDSAVRAGIRRLNRMRLDREGAGTCEERQARLQAFIDGLRRSPVAVAVDAANAQHYEVPAAFFEHVLGPRMKYSSCLFPRGDETLAEAEDGMLDLTCRRAAVENGHRILDLGCGWGSLSLFVAERYRDCRITALSNSASQRQFIEERCRRRRLTNVEVVTADINEYDTDERFDRVVSIEMFEHMRNYRALLAKVARWLADDGRLFVHVFAHRSFAYAFEDVGEWDWMARHFFTGGLMPSSDLLLHFQDDVVLDGRWTVSGRHYAATAERWLERFDGARDALRPVIAATYGDGDVRTWLHRWRIFFMACAELWGTDDGEQWRVEHYRFRRR